MTRYLWVPVTLAALVLGGCEKKAEGQVVAVVNGDEITQGEVAEELKGANLPQGTDQSVVRQAAVQSLVQRRLLAAAAREDGIEKDPTFLVQRKQLEDRLLVQFLAQRAARTMARPDVGEINAYMAAHPGAFADRVIWTVNRLQFPAPKDPALLKGLEDDHSMEAVVARLNAAGVKFAQDTSTLDSAVLAPDVYRKIATLPAGEPYVHTQNGMVNVGVLIGKEPAPLTGDRAKGLATERLLAQRVNSRLEERLKTLKASAEIQYQAGFAPPK